MSSTFTPAAVVVGAAVLIGSAIGLSGQQTTGPGANGQMAALLLQTAAAAQAEPSESEGGSVIADDNPFGDSSAAGAVADDSPFGEARAPSRRGGRANVFGTEIEIEDGRIPSYGMAEIAAGDLAGNGILALTTRNVSTAAEGEGVEASDAARKAGAAGFVDLSNSSPNEKRITAALRSQLKQPIELSSVPLSDAIHALTNDDDLPVLFDYSALDAAVISPDEEVSLVVKGISLGAALRHILRQVEDLTYVIDDEVLLITTVDEAEMMLQLRVYDVANLGIKSKDIADRLVDLVESDSWKVNGTGEGEIAVFGNNGLAVTQTPRVHEKIADFLQQLKGLSDEPNSFQRGSEAIEPRNVDITRGRGGGRF